PGRSRARAAPVRRGPRVEPALPRGVAAAGEPAVRRGRAGGGGGALSAGGGGGAPAPPGAGGGVGAAPPAPPPGRGRPGRPPRSGRAPEAREARRPAGAPHHPYRAKIRQALEAALRAAGDWEALVEHLLQSAREEPEAPKRVPVLDEAAAILEGRLGQPDEAADVRNEIARLRGEHRKVRERPVEVREGAPATPPPELELPEPCAEAPPEPPTAGEAAARSDWRRELREGEDWPTLLLALDQDAETAPPGLSAALYAEGANVASDRLGDLDGALARL